MDGTLMLVVTVPSIMDRTVITNIRVPSTDGTAISIIKVPSRRSRSMCQIFYCKSRQGVMALNKYWALAAIW